MRKPKVIYISTNPNSPTYFVEEPTTNRQGTWDEPYVPKSKVDELEKRVKELQDEVLNLHGQLNSQPAREKL